jgi:hypothetical protein
MRKRIRSLLATQNRDDSSGRRRRSDKRSKSDHRSHEQRRKRGRGGANEDDEYKVEIILRARRYCGQLQYRIKWHRYKID